MLKKIFKKMLLASVLSVLMAAPFAALADNAAKSQTQEIAKANPDMAVIHLASNEMLYTPSASAKSDARKEAASDADNAPVSVPHQAWLVLAALLCFVMRSSRRVV